MTGGYPAQDFMELNRDSGLISLNKSLLEPGALQINQMTVSVFSPNWKSIIMYVLRYKIIINAVNLRVNIEFGISNTKYIIFITK